MNLVHALAEARASRVPLLAFVGEPPTALQGRGAFQDTSGRGGEVDAAEVFRGAAGFVARLEDPHGISALLDRALAATAVPRPGPAVLLIAKDLQCAAAGPLHSHPAQAASEGPSPAPAPSLSANGFPGSGPTPFPGPGGVATTDPAATSNASFPRPDPVAIRGTLGDAAARLRGRRAFIIAGPEVSQGNARDALARLSGSLDAEVAVTPDARDAFANRDPRFRGVAGAMGHPEAERALAGSDFVLLIGTRMPLLARMGLESLLADKAILSLGPEASFVRGREYVEIMGPVGVLLDALNDALALRAAPGARPSHPPDDAPETPGSTSDGPSAGRSGSDPGGPQRPPPDPAPDSLRAAAVMEALRKAVPEKSIILVDAGNTGAFAAHHLEAPPGGRWLLAMGMAGMGYAFGAAIGAAFATGRRCVVVAGDGAFFMHGLEIHTAVEHALPITYVLLDNRAHGMCAVRERLLLRQDGEYNLFGPSRLGAGLGALFPRLPAWDCEDIGAVEAALARAFAHSGPAVISAVLPEVEVPPFAAFRPHSGASPGGLSHAARSHAGSADAGSDRDGPSADGPIGVAQTGPAPTGPAPADPARLGPPETDMPAGRP
jgi:acetolactate synthase-1/2/3 large subunit